MSTDSYKPKNVDLLDLNKLHGKTIQEVKTDKYSECVVVLFTDGSFWVINARNWNCAGARLFHNTSCTKEGNDVPH